MQCYPQYRFEDFYRKHFYQGGLTLNQIKALYGTSVKRKTEEYQFLAAIHGVDISKEVQEVSGTQQSQKAPDLFMFGDPEQYKHLSPDEKQELTDKMINQHKQWSGQILKGKKNV